MKVYVLTSSCKYPYEGEIQIGVFKNLSCAQAKQTEIYLGEDREEEFEINLTNNGKECMLDNSNETTFEITEHDLQD